MILQILILCMMTFYLIILIELQAVLFEYLYDITLLSLIYASNPIYDFLPIEANHVLKFKVFIKLDEVIQISK